MIGRIAQESRTRGFAFILPLFFSVCAGCSVPQGIPGQTVTPPQAFEMWRAEPEQVNILDVRTPAEYVYVGHAPMARNIPLKFMANKWNVRARKPVMTPNANFVAEVRKFYKPDDLIVTMCASGGRSAEAARILKEAGFTRVLNMEGGFDGERGEGCSDHGVGKVIKPGWRGYGLLWTRSVDPEFFYTAD
jgi:rhodanese-related sulfurtransferase